MKVFLEKFIGGVKGDTPGKLKGHDPVKRQVTALYSLLAELYGSDKLVLKAGKLDALKFMRSDILEKGLTLQGWFSRIL